MSLARLASVLATTTGLDVETLGRGGLAAALKPHVDVAAPAALEAFADRLAEDAALRVRVLADLLVHETSFFRYPGSFTFLAGELRRRLGAGASAVRVLSAPCSTGQEPVSVVIGCLEAGIPAEAVTVDAVDVSASIVERARSGVYSPAEARSLGAERARLYLRPAARGLALRPDVLAPIRYQQGDLLDPALGSDLAPYDAILCRNLLIYLTGEARERLVRALRRLLAPDGVLLVGHAEVVPLRALGFAVRGPAEAYALGPAPAASVPPAPPAPRTRAAQPVPRREPVVTRVPRVVATPKRAVVAAAQAESPLVSARRLGQAGRAEEALELLAQVAAERTPTPDELHLTAVLARALGRGEETRQALTRALYLDPCHVAALRLAALVAEEQGERETARRLEARAVRAMAGQPEAERAGEGAEPA